MKLLFTLTLGLLGFSTIAAAGWPPPAAITGNYSIINTTSISMNAVASAPSGMRYSGALEQSLSGQGQTASWTVSGNSYHFPYLNVNVDNGACLIDFQYEIPIITTSSQYPFTCIVKPNSTSEANATSVVEIVSKPSS